MGSGYWVAGGGYNEDGVTYSGSIGDYASYEAGAVWVADASAAMSSGSASDAGDADGDIVGGSPWSGTDSAEAASWADTWESSA